MSFPKILIIFSVVLFGAIGLLSLSKREKPAKVEEVVVAPAPPAAVVEGPAEVALPDADLMGQFFNVNSPKLPIVETVTYSRKVPWMEGRAAWVADYASHYHTSRHFIARSLNDGRDYERQNVANGDSFNVFRADRPISFHLVVDTSLCRMWVYYHDESSRENVLVKTYDVGLGRNDDHLTSGSLTPWGSYKLGEKIAVYRPGMRGIYGSEEIEMLQVFGTRWIPFSQTVGECTAPAKGLGLHCCPWIRKDGQFQEDSSGIGQYSSDGCIRLATEDMEELFAVVITQPTTIYLVPHFTEEVLP